MKKLLTKPAVILLFVLFSTAGTMCFSMQDTDKGLADNQSPITRPSQEKENPINDVDVEMKIVSSQRSFHYPEPIKLQVFLFERHPVLGARVEATVTSPSGSTFEVPFSENILLGATTPESGDIEANQEIIERTLENFNIPVEMGEVNVGPTVTQYTLKPAEGTRQTPAGILSPAPYIFHLSFF